MIYPGTSLGVSDPESVAPAWWTDGPDSLSYKTNAFDISGRPICKTNAFFTLAWTESIHTHYLFDIFPHPLCEVLFFDTVPRSSPPSLLSSLPASFRLL